MADAPSRRTILSAPLVVGCAAFIQSFDTSAIVVSLPAMGETFARSAVALDVVVTSYLLGATAFVPVAGWAADRFGARRAFIAGIIGFGIASLACALATDFTFLVACRAVQGCAGALLLPVGRIIVLRTEPREAIVRAVSVLTFPVMIGPLLGPLVGGTIVQWASWRWLLALNVIVSVAGLLAVLRFVENVPSRHRQPLDLFGLLLSGGGLTCLSYGVVAAARHEASPAGSAMLLVAGALGLALYARHSRRHSHPIIDLAVLKVAVTRLSIMAGMFSRQAVSAVPFLLALLFQLGFGLSPITTGALILSSAAGALFGRSLLGACLALVDLRTLLILNTLFASATAAACGLFTAATPHLIISLLLFMQGASRSLQNISLMTLSLIDVLDDDVGAASTIGSMSQYFAFGMGVSVAVVAIELLGSPAPGALVDVVALQQAFLVIGLLSLASLAWIRRLPAGYRPRG